MMVFFFFPISGCGIVLIVQFRFGEESNISQSVVPKPSAAASPENQLEFMLLACAPDLWNQKLWGWVLQSAFQQKLPGDFDAASSLITTGLGLGH